MRRRSAPLRPIPGEGKRSLSAGRQVWSTRTPPARQRRGRRAPRPLGTTGIGGRRPTPWRSRTRAPGAPPITAEEEAGLAVAGCRPLLGAEACHVLVFDIGGGSTELIWAKHHPDSGIEPIALTSLPFGVVNIAERHGGGEFSPDQYEALVRCVLEDLRPFEAAHGINEKMRQGGVQMIGTSGTVTTLTGVHLGLEKYDRRLIDGLWLTFMDAQSAAEQLRGMNLEQRSAHPCVGPGRADLVVAGCAILEAIRRTWPCEKLRVADRGVREGLLLSLMRWDNRRPRNDAPGGAAT